MENLIIRYAKREELESVNKIRKQVNEVHVKGRSDIFREDENHRRKGIATAIIAFAKEDAKKRGFDKIELDMWEFNHGALAFYESVGFKTFRRYMESYVKE